MSNFLNDLKYWFRLNHIAAIRKYGLLSHLKYVFNFNVSRILINSQMDLSDLPELRYPDGYVVREMDVNNPDEINSWVRIINESYPDVFEDFDSFQRHLHNHVFLTDCKVFLLVRDGKPVGTITAGLYRKDSSVGGAARVAVLPSERGRGLGFFLLSYAYHYLRAQGIKRGETIAAIKREKSILNHFQCGFKPQFDRSKVMFDAQRRMWPARLIAERKAKKLYEDYLRSVKRY